jgi:hypothetical protein
MIVGSNERLFAWMDEGFNTLLIHHQWTLIMGNTRQNRLILHQRAETLNEF